MLNRILFPSFSTSSKQLEKELFNKTVLITGASFGIGRLLAEKLAFKNTQLILLGRTTEELELACKTIKKNGGNAYYISGDLRKESTINEVFDFLKSKNLEVDIFVNNAGKSIRRSIYQSLDRFHDFTRTMSLNYYAPVELGLKLLPEISRRNGQIINISSFIVLLPAMPFWSAYQASKCAFNTWLKSIQPELNKNGVTCSNVYLPLVKTRMIAPTKKFDKVPTMEPTQAMEIIAKSMVKKDYNFKPWWIGLTKLTFKLFGNTYNKRMVKESTKM